MKKGKYIDIYVIMACLSHKKPTHQQTVDELLNNIIKKEAFNAAGTAKPDRVSNGSKELCA